ncbi:hypothetical protein BGX38DRAFT_1146278 [Terfezia claveryi]|nr:hypothetical protein BGX38DRAFT_1146278 [Terfezia claveryi]
MVLPFLVLSSVVLTSCEDTALAAAFAAGVGFGDIGVPAAAPCMGFPCAGGVWGGSRSTDLEEWSVPLCLRVKVVVFGRWGSCKCNPVTQAQLQWMESEISLSEIYSVVEEERGTGAWYRKSVVEEELGREGEVVEVGGGHSYNRVLTT